jgi:hypothetical protein
LSAPAESFSIFLAHGIRKVFAGFATGGMKVCIRNVAAWDCAGTATAATAATAVAARTVEYIFLVILFSPISI